MRPKVPILKPVVWCVTAIGTIYFGLAAFEVRREIKNYTKYGFNSKPDSYDALFAASYSRKHQQSHRQAVSVSPFDLWSNLSETQKVILANIALNTGIYAATSVSGPHTRWYFSHIPITGRNYTMLTSMFGHLSGMHLLFNMYCLYSFGPALARTSTFQDSAPHLAAFYLSAGILSSLAAQIEARVPSRRFWRGSGASGAIMAFVGAFGMSFPHAQIGIIFVPGSVDAQLALSLMAAFETYGLIFGIPYLRWGHSVHLAGLAIGAAYAHFDGNGKIWDATKRTAFNQMRRVGMV
ncbi:hypothetical protein PFICI_11967 [Pestalotiopsis fici W106-1]|uniref:Peptidase S54 rhomboid domain-containing protein n=1 Tax=Pestalotiopsis fici (strain W106-1 / CGMCC3.15140) TaxID=1229662 RepID=W3WRT7_PESFW|nr:uncharacterized protein PFICI_11967 [Pestalotiopsis fici W106-1]ETS76580.1 hypothetical protein PFICI_11967 [Pestalotiopsis fici W106-1]